MCDDATIAIDKSDFFFFFFFFESRKVQKFKVVFRPHNRPSFNTTTNILRFSFSLPSNVLVLRVGTTFCLVRLFIRRIKPNVPLMERDGYQICILILPVVQSSIQNHLKFHYTFIFLFFLSFVDLLLKAIARTLTTIFHRSTTTTTKKKIRRESTNHMTLKISQFLGYRKEIDEKAENLKLKWARTRRVWLFWLRFLSFFFHFFFLKKKRVIEENSFLA